MEMFGLISDFTWFFSQFFLVLSLLFVIVKSSEYHNNIIILLVVLCFTALTWKLIPADISNSLYDISLVYACYVLVFYTTTHKKSKRNKRNI